jgi:lysophospholipase L1-like esterase
VRKGITVFLFVALYAAIGWAVRGSLPWAPLLRPEHVAALAGGWRSPARAAADAQAPAETVAALALPPAQPGAAPAAGWDGFLGKLRALEAGRRNKVRVAHLGDSELFGDGPSGEIRTRLAERFGLGGLGFTLALKPTPHYLREHWRHQDVQGSVLASSYVHGKLVDGAYGPGGVAFELAAGSGARVGMDHPVGEGCTAKLFFARMPNAGVLVLEADRQPLAEVDASGPALELGVASFARQRCPSELGLVAARAPVRVYGWSIEYERPGIVWSSLGMIAAELRYLGHYDPDQLVAALAALEPDLLVLSFGLNLAASPQHPPPTYEAEVEAVLRRLRAGLPEAACLVTGPYPVGQVRGPTIHAEGRSTEMVSDAQRAAAEAAGCAFVDRFRLAGGWRAAHEWFVARPRILGGDYVHLTNEGARRMGDALAGLVLAGVDGRVEAARFTLTGGR